jgi:predicted metal-binding protein
MPALLYVCVRCDRYATPQQPGHGAGLALAENLAAQCGDDLELRQVACLNGCPQPCNVGLRGSGRPTLRFSRITTDDGAALLEFARVYWALAPGADAALLLPASLRAKLSQNTPPLTAPADLS